MTDIIVSCHKCLKRIEINDTRIVMAAKSGKVIPARIERIKRQQGVRPYQWVRLCLACNEEREKA